MFVFLLFTCDNIELRMNCNLTIGLCFFPEAKAEAEKK